MKRVSRLTMEEILTVTITVQILIIIKTTFDYSALKKKNAVEHRPECIQQTAGLRQATLKRIFRGNQHFDY